MTNRLPIRRVGIRIPPIFEWEQFIVAPNDVKRTVTQQGSVAVSMEKPLLELMVLAGQLQAENERLREENEALRRDNTRLNSVTTPVELNKLPPAPPTQVLAKKKGK